MNKSLFKNILNISKSLFHKRILTKDYSTLSVNQILKDNSIKTVKCNIGDNLLEIAHDNDIDLEGACECSCACSTCHVQVEDKFFEKLPEASEEEEDMLDLAFSLRANSRLGCQVTMDKSMDGITVTLPQATRNIYVDGSKPHKH